jgi:hypothetical protein
MAHATLFAHVLAALVATVWLVGTPADACAAAQKSPLISDPGATCAGPAVGKAKVKTRSDGTIKAKVKFIGGPANYSGTVYWECEDVSSGCPSDGCGFLPLGTIDTDASGNGKFKMVLPGNPNPGKFVRLIVFSSSPERFHSIIFPIVP